MLEIGTPEESLNRCDELLALATSWLEATLLIELPSLGPALFDIDVERGICDPGGEAGVVVVGKEYGMVVPLIAIHPNEGKVTVVVGQVLCTVLVTTRRCGDLGEVSCPVCCVSIASCCGNWPETGAPNNVQSMASSHISHSSVCLWNRFPTLKYLSMKPVFLLRCSWARVVKHRDGAKRVPYFIPCFRRAAIPTLQWPGRLATSLSPRHT